MTTQITDSHFLSGVGVVFFVEDRQHEVPVTIVAVFLDDLLCSGNEGRLRFLGCFDAFILGIINAISTTEFLRKYRLLSDNTKRLTPEYRSQLEEWNLFSEIELIDSDNAIVRNLGMDKRLIRRYNQTVFDGKGNYNTDRYNTLKALI